MPNDIDAGCDMEQFIRDVELSVRKEESPVATGSCLNCDAWLEPEIRFCDADCMADYIKRTEGTVRNFEY